MSLPSSENFEKNILEYTEGTSEYYGLLAENRYASFDYCFNYFQEFREGGAFDKIAAPENLLSSCLHLGFYLASWGMYRGKSELLQRSVRYLSPAIELISSFDPHFWEIDAHCYTEKNIELLMQAKERFLEHYERATDTLITKILLGVFGSVPAFDRYFAKGFGVDSLGPASLRLIGSFYNENQERVEKLRHSTIDFGSGQHTQRQYTRAKIIDMAFFVEGRRQEADKKCPQ